MAGKRRQRDYGAEYAARQARSQARYGVSYNTQRRLLAKGADAQVPATEVRAQLSRLYRSDVADHGRVLNRILTQVIRRREDYRAGRPVEPLDLGGDDYTLTAPRTGMITVFVTEADYLGPMESVAEVGGVTVDSPPFDTVVTSIHVVDGQRVTRGQRIVELAPAEDDGDLGDAGWGDEWMFYH